jgi:hypothetical protein
MTNLSATVPTHNGQVGSDESVELLQKLEELLKSQKVSFAARENDVARLIEESLQAERLLKEEKLNIRKRCLDLVDSFLGAD